MGLKLKVEKMNVTNVTENPYDWNGEKAVAIYKRMDLVPCSEFFIFLKS